MSDSDSDDGNTIRYGTPLEPYEEDEIPSKRKYQQPPDQYAVDAHGRRRFHGAFTGGFSAGYGNSVGTPEGWTPSTFKSSRGEKALVASQRPEDFMDEEDRSEFGIAPRQMQTQSEFSGQKRQRQLRYHDGPIPGEPVLEQLVKAVHETAAVKMLRAMGWRPGQGTGDRITRAEKKKGKEQHKVYGCYMPKDLRENPQQSSEDSDSDYDVETLFAPDDYEPYILRRKDDRFGLGYSGLSRHSVLGSLAGEYGAGSSKSHLQMKDKGKKVSIRGHAFGVGAFEADDEDIYASEDMSHYDFELGGPSMEKKKKPIKQPGGKVLEGFVKATKPLPSVPTYPPPALPRDYVPAPAAGRRSRFEPTDKPQRDQGLGRHELTAEARGALLGESPIPPPRPNLPPPQSDVPPPKTDPIAELLGRNVNFVTHTEENKEIDFIPIKDSGKEITKVFKPFMSNPKKQTRYELFLKDKEAYMREGDSDMDRLSEWERNREIVEFEQAAKLYKPLTGIMNDRFTHASEPDDSTNPLTAVAKSISRGGLVPPEAREAASRGEYGAGTRREAAWRPDPLLAKRFNVPEIGGVRSEQKKDDKPKVSYSIFSYLESSVHDKDSFAKEQTQFSGSKSINIETKSRGKVSETNASKSSEDTENNKTPPNNIDTGFNKRLTVAELFLKESEKDLNEKQNGVEVTDTIEKFDKMDLYKSIFLSDSEDEDVAAPINNEISDFSEFIDTPKNVERNTSPPRGIFANIDFDEINSWKRNVDIKKPSDRDTVKDPVSVASAEKSVVNKETEMIEATETYGPKIPENLQKRLEENSETTCTDNFRPVFRSKGVKQTDTIEIDSSSSADSWVEVKDDKSRRQKKKKSKKHKSKHKKSKHKKKDR
ncbi:G patch domain-containing protein 1 homolog [Amyelois transitella]|uniref:G patch domain-containing protein 1 homolog n=1 Tax=Amyelois transitella TaxID=680683 RepID=UPI00298F89C7|nr:G patch domain-containing protein 1 homolog [Amyelois transitella]